VAFRIWRRPSQMRTRPPALTVQALVEGLLLRHEGAAVPEHSHPRYTPGLPQAALSQVTGVGPARCARGPWRCSAGAGGGPLLLQAPQVHPRYTAGADAGATREVALRPQALYPSLCEPHPQPTRCNLGRSPGGVPRVCRGVTWGVPPLTATVALCWRGGPRGRQPLPGVHGGAGQRHARQPGLC